jgi:hypothetical protein
MPWTLDRICALTTNPATLNALHACRAGHPLYSESAWQDAWLISLQRREIPLDAVAWLAIQAKKMRPPLE